jgi:hypothetical protein
MDEVHGMALSLADTRSDNDAPFLLSCVFWPQRPYEY